MCTTYQQLCGALGLLKRHGFDLPWTEIDAQLREMATLPEIDMNRAAEPLHRKYRDMCLEAGLIRPGELFDASDCVPLV